MEIIVNVTTPLVPNKGDEQTAVLGSQSAASTAAAKICPKSEHQQRETEEKRFYGTENLKKEVTWTGGESASSGGLVEICLFIIVVNADGGFESLDFK